MADNNVRFFKVGLQTTYDALTQKEPRALYWIEDTKRLYCGETLYGTGAVVTEEFQGLMSPEDYSALKALIAAGPISTLTPVDGSVVIADGKIGVQVSKAENNLIAVNPDGLFATVNIQPLEDRLVAVEKSVVGGIRYKGAVDTIDQLPTDAEVGDLYEVYEDNSEYCWNGEQWFEYGSSKISYNKNQFTVVDGTLNLTAVDASIVKYRGKMLDKVLPAFYEARKYEITNGTFEDTLVNYKENEIRICFAENSPFTKQAVGTNGDANMYYIGMKIYAPDNATGFKEDLAKTIGDDTMYDFNGDFSGVDEYGRKYSIVWLPVAIYDEATSTWTYYGDNSSADKLIGWDYTVVWYAGETRIGIDQIRINLTNDVCHNSIVPSYMSEYVTNEEIAEVKEMMTWSEL